MRVLLQMTQEDLAEIMCVPKSTISAYENDKVDIKGSVIIELAWHLNTSPNYLLGYEDPPAEEDALTIVVSSIIKKIEEPEEFLTGSNVPEEPETARLNLVIF